jgi:sugar lactone lactonase YvrE
MRSLLAISLCFAAAGCGTDSPGGGGGDDDPGDPGDPPPGFTTGVSMLSGSSEFGYVDGERGDARFGNPVGVLFKGGTVFVADFDNNKIRAVDAETGETTTFVDQRGFVRPFAMAASSNGTIFVTTDANSDAENNPTSGTIWRLDASGNASVVAENIGKPRGLVVLPDGRLAYSDFLHHVVRLVDPNTGNITPLAGTLDAAGMVDGAGLTVARFSKPYGLAVLAGKLVVVDQDNNRVRQIGLDGQVTSLAGGGAGFTDGAVAGAKFDLPQAIAVSSTGDVYVSDLNNFRIRKISGGNVTTVAGSGEGGYADSDDPLAAQLYGLEGIAVSTDGARLFVADGGRGEDVPFNYVRRVELK